MNPGWKVHYVLIQDANPLSRYVPIEYQPYELSHL